MFAVQFAVQYSMCMYYNAVEYLYNNNKKKQSVQARCHKPPKLGIASGRFSGFLRSSIGQSYSCTHNPPTANAPTKRL